MRLESAPPYRPPVWPISSSVGLLLFSGIGLFLSLTTTPDPAMPLPWYANPWMWIATLTSLTIVLMVAVALSAERLRRRMQTALIVSLTIHFLLAIFLSQQILELIVDSPDDTKTAKVPPVPTIPSYYLSTPGEAQTKLAFESPLSTEQATGPTANLNRQFRDVMSPDHESKIQTPTPIVRPTERQLERQQQAAPRRADDLSRLSRNELARAESQPTEARMPRIHKPQRQRSAKSVPDAVSKLQRMRRSEFEPNRPTRAKPSSSPAANIASRPSRMPSRPATRQNNSLERPETDRAFARLADRVAENIASSSQSDTAQRADPIQSTLSRLKSTSLADRVSSSRSAAQSLRSSLQSRSQRDSTESESPKASATPRVATRQQLTRAEPDSRPLSSPTNSRAPAAISDAAASDIAPAPSQLARRATVTPRSNTSTLQRTATRGRPAARSTQSSNGAATQSAVTAGQTGTRSAPRERSATATEQSESQTYSSPRRQIGAATSARRAAEVIDAAPANASGGSQGTPIESIASQRNAVPRQRGAGPSTPSRPATSSGANQSEWTRASNTQGSVADRRSRQDGESGAGVSAGEQRFASAPHRRASQARLEPGQLAEVPVGSEDDLHHDSIDGSSGESTMAALNGSSSGPAIGRTRASIPTRVAARRGSGGLAARKSSNAGLADRRASSRAEFAHDQPSRFLAKRTSSPATLSGRSRRAALPFARRSARQSGDGLDSGAPDAGTEAAIERGLAYLARVQSPSGRWSFQETGTNDESAAVIVSDTAATGLGLLAFLGAGYDHYEGEYQELVGRALKFLSSRQQVSGDLYARQGGSSNQGIWLYSHGIAAIALCEAYGMTGDEALKPIAQRALDFIVKAQHPRYGGWRYSPGINSDLSVSGWQLMALRSGQLAGLEVPKQAIRRVHRLLDSTRDPNNSTQYVYNPWSNDARQALPDRLPNTVMTSVGLLMRLYSGSDRSDARIRAGAEILLARLPNELRPTPRSMQNPNRDAYYWYNATQVMFHMQGESWEQWRDSLYPLLTESQTADGPLTGSWDPFRPAPDRWANHAGRLYLTTMNLLSLEVYYRHLPLYGDTVVE